MAQKIKNNRIQECQSKMNLTQFLYPQHARGHLADAGR